MKYILNSVKCREPEPIVDDNSLGHKERGVLLYMVFKERFEGQPWDAGMLAHGDNNYEPVKMQNCLDTLARLGYVLTQESFTLSDTGA